MRADLHSHSKYSDGWYSVNELLDRAKAHNLDILGLTDHDSVFGVEEAYEYGKKIGLFILKGVELSTKINHDNCHLVCYFPKNEIPDAMRSFSQNIIDKRRDRARRMMTLIKDTFNVNMNLDTLLSGTIITRGNMYKNIMENNPELDEKLASFYVSNDSPCYIPASLMTPEEGIKMMHDMGAIVILAHPTLMDYENVLAVANMGIDGIEARYPRNKEGEEEKFRCLAKEKGLFISAGSDFHGDKKHGEIGVSYLEDNEFNIILNRLGIEVKNENN